MNGVVFDESKIALLLQQLAGGIFLSGNCKMMLCDTITALDHTDTLATLAANEVTFTGYARQTVGSWGTPVLTADLHARAQGATVTFSNTGGGASSTITVWALVDTAGGKVIQAGLFNTPFTIPGSSDYLLTPFFLYTGEIGSEP